MELKKVKELVKQLPNVLLNDSYEEIIADLLFCLYYKYNLDVADSNVERYKILLQNKEDLEKRSEGLTIALYGDVVLRPINLLAYMKNVFCR